jgi:hypothetical protein
MTDFGISSPTGTGGDAPGRAGPGWGSRASVRPLDLGWLAGGLTLAIAFGLTALRARSESDPGPGMSPAAILGFFVLWAGPGIVGLIGTARRRRDVILGAGVACLPMAMLAFSGVTLVLLVPGLLFVYAGLRDPDPCPRPGGDTGQRGSVAGAIAVLLMVGIASLFLRQTACWEQLADGTVRDRPDLVGSVEGGEITAGTGDVVAAGCSTGEIAPVGSIIAVVGVVAAAGLALRVGRTA